MSHRTCEVDGCERKHIARGMCASHYKVWRREQPDYQRTFYERVCDTCHETFRGGRPTARFCDDDCKGLWYSENGVKPPQSRRSGGRRPRLCLLPDTHPARLICPLDIKWCQGCGQEFACRPTAQRCYCSPPCRWRTKSKRRSRRHLVRRQEVFERDGYMCWICDQPTSRTYSRHDIWSPTIDHLVPQSLGGTDELDNLATAHLWCNSVRGASWDISPAA